MGAVVYAGVTVPAFLTPAIVGVLWISAWVSKRAEKERAKTAIFGWTEVCDDNERNSRGTTLGPLRRDFLFKERRSVASGGDL